MSFQIETNQLSSVSDNYHWMMDVGEKQQATDSLTLRLFRLKRNKVPHGFRKAQRLALECVKVEMVESPILRSSVNLPE